MIASTRARWFWRIYIPGAAVATLAMAALFAGPGVEGRFFPIRDGESVTVTERTMQRVCWTWQFRKLRMRASDDLDAYLDINGRPSGVASTYDQDTGLPWGIPRYAVPAREEPYRLHECAPLPPAVIVTDAIRIRQVAWYPGWLGLWRLRVPFPDVVSTPVP